MKKKKIKAHAEDKRQKNEAGKHSHVEDKFIICLLFFSSAN